MKYPDAQPQEEEEEEKTEVKSEEVTNKGNEEEDEEKTEVATERKLSDFYQTIMKQSGGKNLSLLPQLIKKEKENSEIQDEKEDEDEDEDDETSESESEDSSEKEMDESKRPGIFLFEIQIPRSNRLVIPANEASTYFPSLSGSTDVAEVLQITDYLSEEWNMSFIYYSEENAFMITKGWTEFAKFHNLEAMDVIRFYRTIPRLAPQHYLVLYERKRENSARSPEFRTENFLFQLELNTSDIGYCRLFIPRKEVETHFPAIIQTQGPKRKKEIVKFSDERNKNWYMDVIPYNAGSYMIIEGWDEFEKEHNLEAMDLIKFYKPVHPSHKKHFLVKIVRKLKAETYPAESSFTGSGSSCDFVVLV